MAADSEDETTVQSMEVPESTIKSEFLEEISKIPAVNTAREYSTNAYNSVKGLNMFTAAAFSAFESTAVYIALSTKPVLDILQPQVKAIDRLACKGLVIIEQKVPFVTKPPEEVVGSAKELFTSKVEDIKNFGEQKMNEALEETEKLVNRYIPPTSEEASAEEISTENNSNEKNSTEDKSESLKNRANSLIIKTGLRLYGHGIKSIKPLQNRTNEYAQKILYSLPFGLDQTALLVIRFTTSGVVNICNKTANQFSSLPARPRQVLNTANRCAIQLFITLDKKTNAGQITACWLQSFRGKLAALEDLITSLKTEEVEMEIIEKDEAFSESVSSMS